MVKTSFRIISAWENVDKFIENVSSIKDADVDFLWNKYLIEPYWDKVIEWAPEGFEGHKPKPIKDLAALKNQLDIFNSSSIIKTLEDELVKISDILPKDDEDAITIALYPLSPENTIVTERQNGVIGSCEFGNILISINPLAKDWARWVPYVAAHEYHHNVWGHNNIILNGKYKGDLLGTLLNEGQADMFARSLYKGLKPSWLNPIPKQKEMEVWKVMKNNLQSCDFETNCKFIFGDNQDNLLWCIGYLIGNHIIERFYEKNPNTSFMELINMDSEDILLKSEYDVYVNSNL